MHQQDSAQPRESFAQTAKGLASFVVALLVIFPLVIAAAIRFNERIVVAALSVILLGIWGGFMICVRRQRTRAGAERLPSRKEMASAILLQSATILPVAVGTIASVPLSVLLPFWAFAAIMAILFGVFVYACLKLKDFIALVSSGLFYLVFIGLQFFLILARER